MQDIQKKIKDNGLEGKVHARDLVLGGKNPELLNRIVDSKIGWMNAKSDAERGLYAAEAKAIRASQGYQLSDDGSRDVTNDMLGGKATGAGAISTGKIVSRKTSGDGSANAAFENYRATLEAAQKKAQEDALGKVAALTGGYGSSSAAMAATAAGADYSKLLADKELELAETERQRALTAEQQDYQRRLEKAQLAASVGDYSLYEQMGIDMTKLREKEKSEAEAAAAAAAEASAQKERSTYEQLLADAETAAKYGDTSQLRALGIDTRQYDSKFAGSATQKNTGGAGSSAKAVSADFQTDPSAALYAAGAETFNQAYALLLSNGYSSTAATTIAENYLAELDDMKEADGDVKKEDEPKSDDKETKTISNVVEYLIKGGTSAAASLGVDGKDITSGKEAAYMYLYKLVENGLDPSVAESIAEKYGISAPADMRA
ncbi:MAG: hypothetical protein DBX93_04555 [Oscillospiraceae bacterium]|nr:MAG: hypothetical protein DBX93_04555 [Oscillospiraceae bacterium]